MIRPLLAISAALLAVSGCKETSAPIEAPTYRLTATITENNTCTVNVLGKSYSSVNQVRGDVPAQFIGTVANESYHGFGCWVGTDGSDGDLIVLFSGNNLGKPLAPGTYPLAQEVLDETPPKMSAVSFRPSEFGPQRLRSKDGSPGQVVVAETASGGRTVTIDVELVRWGAIF